MQTTYVLNFTLLPTGLPKKKKKYTKKQKTKLKHYQVYKRTERIGHIEIKQINTIF